MQPIFVGDVQGCADELDAILARADQAFGDASVLWVVGDAINRGPSNLRVLRALRERVEAGRAHYVLGNHEISLLRCAFGLRPLARTDTFGDVLDARDADDWIDWLRSRPLVVPGTLGAQRFAMVHAAAHPDWDLDALVRRAARVQRSLSGDRDAARALLSRAPEAGSSGTLARLTRCRSVAAADPEDWSEAPPEAGRVAWHEAWSRRGHDYGVVYGHWSLQGLHVAPGLRGLDTGCVHHGRSGDRHLTAWVPDPRRERPFDVPDTHFWQIPARRRYAPAAAS